MPIDLIEELRWRGMLHDAMPGTGEMLAHGKTRGYIGFDPTADSLHVGHLVQVMLLRHLQRAGHQPVALVGGATGMIGDPSGKSAERNLLTEKELRANESGTRAQLEHLLTDADGEKPIFVNNYDWFKGMGFLEFLREVGKHITVSYMMAKDSVQNRLATGLSFTEFSYQLVQGYDFFKLWKEYGCTLQMGGSDQWGNIVTGTELIRRKEGGEAYAITINLITKADGTKFGKTESGAVWLSPGRTSPYAFYQFWLNVSDADGAKYIRTFTLLSKEKIESIEAEHAAAPHQRLLQRTIAESVTDWVHGEEERRAAQEASELLFGSGSTEALRLIKPKTLLDALDGVPLYPVPKEGLKRDGINLVELLSVCQHFHFSQQGRGTKAHSGRRPQFEQGKDY